MPVLVQQIYAAVRPEIVGRERELTGILAAIGAGRDVLLEGPPGIGKSTILRAITRHYGIPLVLVEGNADLTPAKLIGYHNPAQVVRHGYRAEDFVPGPLPDAMQRGGFLYIEEFNLSIPRYGTVRAAPGFHLIAAMNPFDNVGTLHVSQSVFDRLCRLPIGYQSAAEERGVVRLRTGSSDDWLIDGAVALIRATRAHEELRMGSSVRGAIDLVLVAGGLADLRGVDLARRDHAARDLVLDAALLALSGRVTLAETATRSREAIIRELWENIFYFVPQAARGEHMLDLDAAVALPRAARRPAGPLILPRRAAANPVEQPRRGKVEGAARVYRPDEVHLVRADRGAASSPRRDPTRDGMMREVVKDGAFDAEVFGKLYAKDEDAAMALLGDLWTEAPEEQLRDLTRHLAMKIVITLARRDHAPNPGKGKLRPVRYRFNSDDLDLDRTLEEIAAKAYPEYDDFWVRERVRARRTYALLLDVSGSMRGAQLMKAALAAGSLARNLHEDDLAVALFWRDAAVIKRATQPKAATQLIDEILSVRARGLTNLRLGLEVGLRELERAATQEKVGIIFTDGISNIGEDPLPMAAKYPRLHVIGISLDDGPVRACQELAARGRGRCVFIQTLEDIPAAVSHCMQG